MEGGRLPLSFLKIDKKYSNFGKNYLVCVHLWVKFLLEMQFWEYIGEKTRKSFPAEPFFCMSCMKCLSKCLFSKKPVLPGKIPGCVPVTFNTTFHPNFHPIIWVFANLPIYRKLIHDNISLVFSRPKIFYLVLFWRRCKIVCTYKHLH